MLLRVALYSTSRIAASISQFMMAKRSVQRCGLTLVHMHAHGMQRCDCSCLQEGGQAFFLIRATSVRGPGARVTVSDASFALQERGTQHRFPSHSGSGEWLPINPCHAVTPHFCRGGLMAPALCLHLTPPPSPCSCQSASTWWSSKCAYWSKLCRGELGLRAAC
jgi:hypothetical protein